MKWKYLRGVDLANDQLENLGKQGWELVSVVHARKLTIMGSDVDGKNRRRDPRTGWVTADDGLLFYFKQPVELV